MSSLADHLIERLDDTRDEIEDYDPDDAPGIGKIQARADLCNTGTRTLMAVNKVISEAIRYNQSDPFVKVKFSEEDLEEVKVSIEDLRDAISEIYGRRGYTFTLELPFEDERVSFYEQDNASLVTGNDRYDIGATPDDFGSLDAIVNDAFLIVLDMADNFKLPAKQSDFIGKEEFEGIISKLEEQQLRVEYAVTRVRKMVSGIEEADMDSVEEFEETASDTKGLIVAVRALARVRKSYPRYNGSNYIPVRFTAEDFMKKYKVGKSGHKNRFEIWLAVLLVAVLAVIVILEFYVL